MSKTVRQWVLRLIKFAVCAGALWYLSDKVALNDRIRLADDPDTAYRLVGKSETAITILRDGQTVEVPRDRIARHHQLKKGQRAEEKGLQSLVVTANRRWGLLAIAVFGPVTFLVAWRIQLLLAAQQIFLRYGEALLLTFAGNFFNFALPGTTGGDLYKAYHVARRTRRRTEGVTIILLDRAIGLATFLVLAVITILAFWRSSMIGPFGKLVGCMAVAFVVGSAFFFSRRLRRVIRFDALRDRLPLAEKVRRADATIFSLRRHRWLSAYAFVLTLVSHLLIVACIYFAARGFGMDRSADLASVHLYWACLLATVVGFLVAAIPISFQGFGLLEAVFYKVLVEGGWATPSQMLAVTLSLRLIQIFWSLPGVIVPWLGFARPTDTTLEAFDAGHAAESTAAS
jgi:hypothetical protein